MQIGEAVKTIEWDMGHRVPNHKSKCRNLHGHRYKVFIHMKGRFIDDKGASDEGMVMDFSDIKAVAQTFIDGKLDHGYMYQTGDQIGEVAKEMGMKTMEVPFVPTAENIAHYLFHELESRYKLTFQKRYGDGVWLDKITLYETPNSFVIYKKGDDKGR